MPPFRELVLPGGITGHLYLHNMPGRSGYGETWEQFQLNAGASDIDTIVCLCSDEELGKKSPEYAHAVKNRKTGFNWKSFPIADYQVPDNLDSFTSFVSDIASRLGDGRKLLLHCGAGIGRTGMTAVCILLALGVSLDAANKAVKAAGSFPETQEQRKLILEVLDRIRAG